MLIDFQQLETSRQESNTSTMISIGDHSFPVSYNLPAIMDILKYQATVHWLSDGEWSMHELLLTVLSKIQGSVEIWISSYAFSEKPARILASLISEGRISSLHCVIDNRIDVRSASALTLLQNCARRIKMI